VERGEFREELAVDLEREQLQVVANVREHLGCLLQQEHLPATALPAQVVDVVDVAHQVGLLETDPMPDLVIRFHYHVSLSVSMVNTTGSAMSRKAVWKLAMRMEPARNSTHRSGPGSSAVSASPPAGPGL